jgi:hypothetical protein
MTGLISHLHTDNGRVSVPLTQPEPVLFRNAFFEGKVIFMHREITESTSEYSSTRRRFWELRWQGRFLRRPIADVFIGAEVRQPLPTHGIFLRATMQCALAVVRGMAATRGARVLCNYESEISENRKFVLFPLSAADVKICSASEAEAPNISGLSQLVGEVFDGEIDENKIYTFAFYTMYTDLANWCFANFPVIAGTSLASFVGHQPIFAVMREAETADVNYFLEISFQHAMPDVPDSSEFESAFSDPDDQMALLDLTGVGPDTGNSRSRRGLRRKLKRCFGECWGGVNRFVSRSTCWVCNRKFRS